MSTRTAPTTPVPPTCSPAATEETTLRPSILVAGIGNLFLGDDGFGPEVARVLASRADLPEDVRVVDYGIRGMHLAYDILDGCEALVLVDAIPGDGEPGEITVMAVGPEDLPGGEFDAHGMDPVSVLSSLTALGGSLPPTFVVGCVPATVEEHMGLSEPVGAAVPEAASAVIRLIGERIRATATSGRS